MIECLTQALNIEKKKQMQMGNGTQINSIVRK